MLTFIGGPSASSALASVVLAGHAFHLPGGARGRRAVQVFLFLVGLVRQLIHLQVAAKLIFRRVVLLVPTARHMHATHEQWHWLLIWLKLYKALSEL